MPLPLFLVPLLTRLSPLKKFLTLKNILIMAGAAAAVYFVWSYNSLRTENGELSAQLKTAHTEIEQGNANLAQCYTDVADLNTSIVELQTEHDETLNTALDRLTAICVRKDTVTRLNNTLKQKGVIADPEVAKPAEVLELEQSLNQRLNDRRIQ